MHVSKITFSAHKYLLAAILTAVFSLLTGCASPITAKGLTPTAIQPGGKHSQTVTISVSGGSDTRKSHIQDDTLAQAITDTINNNQLFSRVVPDKGGDLLLVVSISSVEQPSFGVNFTVRLECDWTLQKVDTGAILWQEVIKSEYTSQMFDAFAGAERLRLATEGAGSANIAQGLGKISALKF